MNLNKVILMPALFYLSAQAGESADSYLRCRSKEDKIECATNLENVNFSRGKKSQDSNVMIYEVKGKLPNGSLLEGVLEANFNTRIKIIIEEDSENDKGYKMLLDATCPEENRCSISSPFSGSNELKVDLLENTVYKLIYNNSEEKQRNLFRIKCRIDTVK